MNVAIRYFSRGGNVEAMAKAMSRGLGVEAVSIDEPGAQITKHVDLLFIGGALYKFQLDPRLKQFLQDLPEGLIDEAVVFGSSWLTRRPIYLIQDYLKAKSIKLNKQAIWSRNKPNEDLLGVIEYFAKNELTRDRSLDGLPPYLIFKRSQELKEEREAAAAAGEAIEDDEAAREAAIKRRAAEEALADAKAAEEAARAAQEAAEAAAAEAAEAARLAALKLEAANEAEDALGAEAGIED